MSHFIRNFPFWTLTDALYVLDGVFFSENDLWMEATHWLAVEREGVSPRIVTICR